MATRSRRRPEARPGCQRGGGVDHQPPVDDVVEIVRASFASYSNHYRANPLLDRDAALEGYCEWAALLAGVDGSAFVLRDDLDEGIGVVLVDWSVDLPDIKLAGMRPSAQGRGLYRVAAPIGHGRCGRPRAQRSPDLHAVSQRHCHASLGESGLRARTNRCHPAPPQARAGAERASPASPER